MTTKAKRKNPYQMLFDKIIDFCSKVKYRHKVCMFNYDKPEEGSEFSFDLQDLYERTRAADQLGYEVRMEVNDSDNLCAYYVKKVDIPYEWED